MTTFSPVNESIEYYPGTEIKAVEFSYVIGGSDSASLIHSDLLALTRSPGKIDLFYSYAGNAPYFEIRSVEMIPLQSQGLIIPRHIEGKVCMGCQFFKSVQMYGQLLVNAIY